MNNLSISPMGSQLHFGATFVHEGNGNFKNAKTGKAISAGELYPLHPRANQSGRVRVIQLHRPNEQPAHVVLTGEASRIFAKGKDAFKKLLLPSGTNGVKELRPAPFFKQLAKSI